MNLSVRERKKKNFFKFMIIKNRVWKREKQINREESAQKRERVRNENMALFTQSVKQ